MKKTDSGKSITVAIGPGSDSAYIPGTRPGNDISSQQ